jgi:hypothetical protein
MFGKITKNSFHDIGRSPDAADYLALQLERLMALPLTTPAEVKNWYGECDAVQKTLQSQFPQFEPFHEVWHFFADADIRGRDVGYRDHQHRLMSEYVQHLRHKRQDG